MDKVSKYIKENWKKTMRPKDDLSGNIKINHPFMSPCIVDTFTDMFYWDTYWINLGLLEDNETEQALNNIDNFSIFIDRFGYIPNSNKLVDRSQPPFFTKMVYDYYLKTNDIKVIEKYVDFSIKEYSFWQSKRRNEFGLNFYASSIEDKELLEQYQWTYQRLGEEKVEDKNEIILRTKGFFALCESGLDCNLRFRTNKRNADVFKFIPLDINCILYDVEIMISKMLSLIKRNDEAKKYAKYASTRKELINKYLYCKEKHMYLDYNFVDNTFSNVVCATSMYPYAFGISNNKEDALKVLECIEYEHGISTCMGRNEDIYLQWDYPCMWPPTTHLTYIGLINVCAYEEANRVAKKYIDTVSKTFEKTGKIWEKYDSVNGDVGTSIEYETPEMLGWSAGVYRFFIEKTKNS